MGGTLWEYENGAGVTVRGYVEKTFDRGGTDVTYMFRRTTGECDMVSGSRLKAARVISTYHAHGHACYTHKKPRIIDLEIERVSPRHSGHDIRPCKRGD